MTCAESTPRSPRVTFLGPRGPGRSRFSYSGLIRWIVRVPADRLSGVDSCTDFQAASFSVVQALVAGVLLIALSNVPAKAAEAPGPASRWLELHATVTDVKDGNNMRVLDRRGFVHQVRLSGSDAPEMTQAGGKGARDRLRDLVLRKLVRIEHRYFDVRGRILGKVYVGDVWVNRLLVTEGLAWFRDPDGDCPELAKAAEDAKAAGHGIWKQSSPVPPWQWRAGARIARPERERDSMPRFPRSQSSNEPKLISR